MAFDTPALISGLYGIGGMLIGGFIVYHRVEGLMKTLKEEIKRVDDEQKDELKQVWVKFDSVQTIKVCDEHQRGCGFQFIAFKDGQEEIKVLFKELRGDLKAELKLLRECITAATQGRC